MLDDLKIKDPDIIYDGDSVTKRVIPVFAKHRGLEIRDGISIV